MPARRRSLAIALMGLLATPSAWGQTADQAVLGDLTLEQLVEVQLVSTPSKRAQSLRDAPALITIVTAEEIRRHGYRTLGEVLRTVPGFYVTYDRNYSYLGVRGFSVPGDYNTRILLLIDGVRTNDNVYDAAYVAREFVLDPDLIARVEVSRGPGASVYGNSAFFAVVNVVTKRGRDLDGGQLSAGTGSFGTFEGTASYGRRLPSGIEFVASASLLDSDGQTLTFPEFSETDGGVVRNGDTERTAKAFASAAFNGLSVEAAYSDRSKRVPTASFGTVFADTRARTRDELRLVSAAYERPLGRNVGLTARLFSGAYDYSGTYPYAAGETTDLYLDFTSGRWWGAEVTGIVHAGRHTVLVGGEYLHSTRQTQNARYESSPEMTVDLQGDDRRLGLHAQDDIALGERVRVSVGGRFDHYQDLADRFNPRLALMVSPDHATTVKLLYGQAFRAPNEYEEHYYAPTGDLRAETIRTVEAAVERTLGPHVRLVGSLHSSAIKDLITLQSTADGKLLFRNAGRIAAVGGELALQLKLPGGVAGRLSHSVQRTRDELRQPLPNSPRHLLKANLSVPIGERPVWAGATAHYVSSRRMLSGDSTGGYVAADLNVFTRLGRGFEASASVSNLFDRRYAHPASDEHVESVIPQDGRSVRFWLGWRF